MNVRGKVCLVTGATSGIGLATVERLILEQAIVVGVSRGRARTSEASQAKAGHHVTTSLQADIAKASACRACVEEAAARHGGVDVLVHCAGGAVPGDLLAVSESAWMDAFSVHVHAVFHLARAAVPFMKKQGGGAIVLVGSAAGLRGCQGAIAYGVAKGALPQMARNLARELANQNIRVNCVSPGVIRTPFQNYLTAEQVENNIRNRIPLHREGTASDVAEVIAMLISNEFITGENIVVDGGMSMRMV